VNWINKIKKLGESIKQNINKKFPSKSERENSAWTSCHNTPVLKKDLEENLFVCPTCNHHHRISPVQRFGMLFDSGNYKIIKTPIVKDDPLSWTDTKSYKVRLKEARKKTNQDCAILVASGKINGIDTTVAASNFDFIGGSLGASETEAIIYAVDYSIKNSQPFVNVCASGGARMYESLIALSGMTKVTLAINELRSNGLPYFVIYSHPVAGGVSASMAMIGDLQISEPNCLIAFSGRRVVQATVKEELPPDFQTAEFCLKHGMIDRITERKNLAKEIGILLSILLKKNSEVSSENNEQASELSIQTREAS
tara:strand:+ start:713 stop:1645 length:933 start_codon:yes stop_codon:yes gene_type:complete